MFLYLSSQGLGPSPHLLAEHSRGPRALVVANAVDDLSTSQRDAIVGDEIAQISRLGFDVDELDLRAHFGGAESIADVVTKVDLLWVIGGNTFTLCRAFAASGVVKPIREAVAGGLVYAGYSAGAVAAGPDLAGIDLVDDRWTHPAIYPSGLEPTTLSLVPERVIPHADPTGRGGHVMKPVIECLQRAQHEHVLLRDGQVLVIRGSSRWIEST